MLKLNAAKNQVNIDSKVFIPFESYAIDEYSVTGTPYVCLYDVDGGLAGHLWDEHAEKFIAIINQEE
jgi:hypothetical protein